MSNQLTSDNFYYVKNTLPNETNDEYSSIDIGSSGTNSSTSHSSQNGNSGNILAKRWKGRTNVVILTLVSCNLLLTVLSLSVGGYAIHLALGQMEQQHGLSDTVSTVETQLQLCNQTVKHDIEIFLKEVTIDFNCTIDPIIDPSIDPETPSPHLGDLTPYHCHTTKIEVLPPDHDSTLH